MATVLRKTGIDIVGDIPWGTHFCHFYETKDDLLDTLVPYFKAGLDDGEFCVWVLSDPLSEAEAWTALGRAVPDLDRHVTDRSIEVFPARDWYLQGGKFDLQRVTGAWNYKLARAPARSYPGMRVSGNAAWLQKKDWQDFCEYEEQLNGSISGQRMTVLCTYPLVGSAATELLDVVRTHQFAIAKRQGIWEVVETPQRRQAKTEIERLNRELERRVAERTAQLEATVDELRRSDAPFRLLAEAIPHQVWGSLPDDSMNYCNQRWSDYSGLTLKQAKGQPWSAHLHPADVERARDAREEARSRRAPYQVEVRLRAADGSYRRFVSRAAPLFDEAGRLTRWFGTNSDVEDARRASEALHDMQVELAHVARLSTLGELTASLAHELNQPLAAIAGNGNACLRWLRHEQPDLVEATQAVERMIRDAKRAGDVIAHARALVRKSPGETGPVDVTEMIREALALIRPELQRHRVVIQEVLADDLPSITGDRIQFQQLVLNLIINGIDAMADVSDRPRTLRVSSRRQPLEEGAGILVGVTDSGIGLAGPDLGRLFEAFYTTKPSGLGMGLSISRSIVQAHGGRIWATRNADHGLTLQFTLPESTPSATYTKV